MSLYILCGSFATSGYDIVMAMVKAMSRAMMDRAMDRAMSTIFREIALET